MRWPRSSAILARDRWLKPALAVGLCAPLLWLAWAVREELAVAGSALGADPAEATVLFLGEWGLRFLLLGLLISTLGRRFRWGALAKCRRMVGLFAFAYVALHFVAYLGLLAGFDGSLIIGDLTERSYIIAGTAGLILLVPLALTSTRRWQRRLGRNWRRLHRLVYPAVGLGLLHLVWLTKDGYADSVLYLAAFVGLMVERALSARQLAGAGSRSGRVSEGLSG